MDGPWPSPSALHDDAAPKPLQGSPPSRVTPLMVQRSWMKPRLIVPLIDARQAVFWSTLPAPSGRSDGERGHACPCMPAPAAARSSAAAR
jgi:hypothetical protein